MIVFFVWDVFYKLFRNGETWKTCFWWHVMFSDYFVFQYNLPHIKRKSQKLNSFDRRKWVIVPVLFHLHIHNSMQTFVRNWLWLRLKFPLHNQNRIMKKETFLCRYSIFMLGNKINYSFTFIGVCKVRIIERTSKTNKDTISSVLFLNTKTVKK